MTSPDTAVTGNVCEYVFLYNIYTHSYMHIKYIERRENSYHSIYEDKGEVNLLYTVSDLYDWHLTHSYNDFWLYATVELG